MSRWLTESLSGIGGRVKVEPEDFVVEELPLYLPGGDGEHLYLWIEKRDVSGERLLDQLARRLRISRNDIGMAGLKDRRAVTRQFVSVPQACEPRLAEVDGDGIRLLSSARHRNKLRTGHLAGNRFDILIRDVAPAAATTLAAWLEAVRCLGVPNPYGEQRFGYGGETLALGEALLRGERRPGSIPPARRRFLLRLALSSVQSRLFNQVLDERLRDGLLHRALAGDVMQVVASGGPFVVEDPEVEQRRCDAREIVLTGPMFGPKMKPPRGVPAEREARVLDSAGLTAADFERFAELLPGTRRPLVVWPEDLSGEAAPEGVRLRFTLPPGAYATALLDEIRKPVAVPIPESADGDDAAVPPTD